MIFAEEVRCLVIVLVANVAIVVVVVMDHDVLEEHVVGDETVDVEDLTIEREAHAADIEDTVAISNVDIAVIVIVNLDAVLGISEVSLTNFDVHVVHVVAIVHS